MDAARQALTYLDSSALVRVLLGEGDTRAVDEALRREPVSSVLTHVEVHAAIYGRWRHGNLLPEQRNALLLAAEELFAGVALIDLTGDILEKAEDTVRQFAVRTLDALHLASALRIERQAKRRGVDLRFCTADFRQAEAAVGLFGEARVTLVPPRR